MRKNSVKLTVLDYYIPNFNALIATLGNCFTKSVIIYS